MRYSHLIFDFDGTLADTFPSFLENMKKTAEHFGLRDIDETLIEELRSLGAREIIQRLGIPAWKVPLVARFTRRLIADNAAELKLFPGIPELLAMLRQRGHTLSIVSSNSEANIRAILGAENVAHIAHFACGASLFGKASRFRQVLKRSGTTAAVSLAIGDEIRDIEAAREVGLAFGAVSWGYTRGEALRAHASTFVFDRVEDILGVLTSDRIPVDTAGIRGK